jgi:NADPH2:quinone reductase
VVIAVVSSAEKGRIAEVAGAHEIVLVDGFRDAVRHLTRARAWTSSSTRSAERGSSIRSARWPVKADLLVLGFTSGTIPTVKVNRLLLGNTAVIGVGSAELWRREPGYLRQQWDELIPLLESRAIDPVVGRVFPLEDVAAAIREMDRAPSRRQGADPASLDGVPRSIVDGLGGHLKGLRRRCCLCERGARVW